MTETNLRIDFKEEHSQVFSCDKRFIVLVAGRRWGKTTLAIWWLIIRAFSGDKRTCYYIAPTYSQAKRIAWSVLKRLLTSKLSVRINEQELLMELKNGSVIQLHGADRPDRLRGVSLDAVVLDEFADMKLETWTAVTRPALSDRLGRALFIGTPRNRNHFYDLYCNAKFRNDWAVFHFPTAQGGYVSPNELLAAANEMTPQEYAREFLASFEDSGARVYRCFDLEKNVSSEITAYRSTPLLIGMDFNVSPMTAVIAQRIGTQCHVVDEIVLNNSNTSEMMEEINRRYEGWEGIVHPDPSACSRKTSAPAGETDLTIIQRAGWQVFEHSWYKVIDRINCVNAMLLNAHGARRLIISPVCRHLIRALDCLTYKEGTKIPDKTSGFEHISDALGYMVIAVFPLVTNSFSVQTQYV